jgi:NACalpha-BTF3-like transcription factor
MGEEGLARPVEMKNGVMITNGSDPLGTVARVMGVTSFRNVNDATQMASTKEGLASVNKLYQELSISKYPVTTITGKSVMVADPTVSVLDDNIPHAIIGIGADVESTKELTDLYTKGIHVPKADTIKTLSGDTTATSRDIAPDKLAEAMGLKKNSNAAMSLERYANRPEVIALINNDPRKAGFLAITLDTEKAKADQARDFSTSVKRKDIQVSIAEMDALDGIKFNPSSVDPKNRYNIDPDRITSPEQLRKISTLMKQIETHIESGQKASRQDNPALKDYGINDSTVLEYNKFTKAIHDDILKDSKEIASRNPGTLVASANSIIYPLNLEAEQTSSYLGTDTYEWRRISKLRKMVLKVKTIEDVREIQFEVKEDEYMEEAADSLVSGFRGSMSKFGLDEADPFLTTKGSQERRVRLVAKNNGVSEAEASKAIRERALQLAGEDADSIIQQEINQRGEAGIEPTEEPKIDGSVAIRQLLIDAQKRGE